MKIDIDIEAIKEEINILNFKRTDLLEVALTHPSYLYEQQLLTQKQKDSQKREYRRLATLGDTILSAAVTDYLYHEIPTASQGDLSKIKSSLITRQITGKYARKLKLKQFCLLSQGETKRTESEQIELFGEMFESLLGAIYLGLERDFAKTCSWLINRFILDALDESFDEEDDNSLNDEDSTLITTRDYLDMIGLEDFPDYGWCPGDD